MKYLMAIWDGGGATPPNLGVARTLIDRGHKVVVYGDPTLADDVAATGAVHRSWPTAPQRRSTALEDDVLKDWEARTPIAAIARLRDRLIAGPAALFAADVIAAIDAESGVEPFDVVLADGILLGALVGAEARNLPSAALVGTVYLAPSPLRPPAGRLAPARGPLGRMRDRAGVPLSNMLWRGGLGGLNAARIAHGLAPVSHLWDQWDRATRVLMLTSSAFDDPPPDAPNVRYVGPVLDDLAPDGDLQLPPGDDPLVVVGLSSSYMRQAELLQRIATALSGLPVRAVVTTGPAIEPSDIVAAPNVAVVRSARHNELFASAAVVVTHAGHGTLIKAIAAGVPVVCIPLGRDQPDNAARAARHGVGIVLPPRSHSDAIARGVRRVLDESAYRAAAAALGRRVRSEAASGALVAELEGLAAVSPG